MIKRTWKYALLAGALLFASSTLLRAASFSTLRTLDGKSYEGELHFDADGQSLVITPRSDVPVKVDLANLLEADFKAPPPAATTRPVAPLVLDGPLPKPWAGQDMGVSGGGQSWNHRTGFTLKVGPTPLPDNGKTPPNVHIVYQQITGDATLIAHIAAEEGKGQIAYGLMLRSDVTNGISGGSSAQLATMWQKHALSFQIRAGGAVHATPLQRPQGGELWLKLVRSGQNVLAYESSDGESWDNVDSADASLPAKLYVGFFISSKIAASVTFDNVSLTTEEAEREEGAAAGKSVLLRRGGALGGITVVGADDTSIKITRKDGGEASLPVSGIARLDFRPIKPAMLAKVPPHATGLLLERGDFVEGDFKGISSGKVIMSSVLFGIQRFDVDGEVASLILHDVEPSRSAFVVRTWDNSIYTAKSLKADGQSLTIEDELAGTVKVPLRDVAQIRAGGARFDDLVDLYPEQGRAEPATVNDAPMRLLGVDCSRAIAVSNESSVTYNVAGKYKLLVCRVGVPDYLMPTGSARFIASADGREIFRSPPMSSIDDPIPVALPIAGANKITLSVERTDGAPWPILGVWSDAALVK